MSSQHNQLVQRPTSFADVLLQARMPEPGPEYYAARRHLWLTPFNPTVSAHRLSMDRNKLDKGLKEKNYTTEAWRLISSGQRLKRSLPMNYLIKIVHAAWLREKVWPVGVVVPDSDDNEQLEIQASDNPVETR